MSLPVISIVLPAYNAARSLSVSIKSVLCQTYTDFELIVVDDGSMDDTVAIVNTFVEQDSRVFLYSQVNAGANAARQKGVSVSRGHYVTFIDADDTIEDVCLEAMIQEIEETDILITRAKTNIVLNKKDYLTYSLDHLLPKELWGKLFKREILTTKVMSVPRELMIGEDFIWNVRVSEYVNTVKIITNNYYHYTMDNNVSLMHKFKKSLVYEEQFYTILNRSVLEMGFGTEECYRLLTAQRFYTFFGIVRDLECIDMASGFLKDVAQPSTYLKEKVNAVLYWIMCLPNLTIKIKALKLYIKLRKL